MATESKFGRLRDSILMNFKDLVTRINIVKAVHKNWYTSYTKLEEDAKKIFHRYTSMEHSEDSPPSTESNTLIPVTIDTPTRPKSPGNDGSVPDENVSGSDSDSERGDDEAELMAQRAFWKVVEEVDEPTLTRNNVEDIALDMDEDEYEGSEDEHNDESCNSDTGFDFQFFFQSTNSCLVGASHPCQNGAEVFQPFHQRVQKQMV
ncbi:hypothetical protein FIBSPDRAFT_902904 [Athelia psychrophila]|uniref:Uncharacterized protein n=1 Tax=Athelia psychrophila TaxID=1759441 RepID=A0A167WMN2_9AGAM|nr:hypothetical protein FIBSPDRAFT_902904 [Fibularhizoctonia sp. CBS 109695]